MENDPLNQLFLADNQEYLDSEITGKGKKLFVKLLLFNFIFLTLSNYIYHDYFLDNMTSQR